MPPDATSLVRKFIPNNPKLSNVVNKVCQNCFPSRFLPMELIKMLVTRAFELSRQTDMEVESKVFEEKLTSYANQIKPRFLAKINEMRRRGKKW